MLNIPLKPLCFIHDVSSSMVNYHRISDRKDPRIDKVFSDICIPNNVNGGDIDIDFSKYSVEEFLREIMKLKN